MEFAHRESCHRSAAWRAYRRGTVIEGQHDFLGNCSFVVWQRRIGPDMARPDTPREIRYYPGPPGELVPTRTGCDNYDGDHGEYFAWRRTKPYERSLLPVSVARPDSCISGEVAKSTTDPLLQATGTRWIQGLSAKHSCASRGRGRGWIRRSRPKRAQRVRGGSIGGAGSIGSWRCCNFGSHILVRTEVPPSERGRDDRNETSRRAQEECEHSRTRVSS